MRVVAKFGGTSLGNGERVNRAADSVAGAVEAGHEVAVVASAMGSTTDFLLDAITFETDEADEAEIVSMGERTSVRMLKAALGARDVDARFVEPGMDEWPVVTDEHGEVDVEETRRRAKQLAADMSAQGYVPVISGFVAEDHAGNVTTLGRGGSDTTALMMGNYTGADEVVIITDVEGVMTGDPRVVEGARNVGEITVDELRNLSFRGAEVVAPSALSYKTADMVVRVAHYQHGDLLSGGTTIEGQFENLIDLRETPLASLTVAGRAIRNTPGILSDLSVALSDADVNVDAVSSGMDSVTFYVDAEAAERAENVLHQEVIDAEPLSSVTVDDGVAVIRVTGGQLPNQSGILQDIVAPISAAHITIHDLITSATSVSVLVDWGDREDALEIIQDAV
jgi:aspartate kinase